MGVRSTNLTCKKLSMPLEVTDPEGTMGASPSGLRDE